MVTGLKEFIGNPELSAHIHTYILDTCICIYVSHLKFAQKPWQKIELPKTTEATATTT